MKKIPFFLVTGFLGSGKTTFLKHFLKSYADIYRIAVIQNEFAPGNIDGKFLAECGKKYTLVEINRGSVFCVCLLSDFKATLLDIITTRKPDIIILEATGLADPIAIGQFIQASDISDKMYLANIWCIADISKIIEMQNLYQRVNHQLRVADSIILNRTDQFKGDIKETQKQLRAINPFAQMHTTNYCEIDLSAIQHNPEKPPVALRQQNIHAQNESCGRPEEIGFSVIKTTRKIKQAHLMDFLDEKSKYIFRIKGIVQLDDQRMVAVQSTFGDTKISPITGISGPTEIIALGVNLDSDRFKEDFRRLLEY
jgi:G3E family GTPase